MKTLKIMALLLTTMMMSNTEAKAGKNRDISRDLIIDANIEDVWQVLGKDFENAYKWASGVKHSEALNNESMNGSTCTERGCDVPGFGKISEEMTAYSDEDHILGYKIVNGLPKMMAHAENTWTLTALPDGRTKVEMRLKAETQGFMGWLMGGMMEKKMTKLIDQATEELKFYVETGKVHPRALAAA